MNQEIKKEAIRQYVKYFKAWFIITGVILLITVGLAVGKLISREGNQSAPKERVYDYAGVLSDEEEEALRKSIAECEQKAQIDIVVVTIDEPVGKGDSAWEKGMMNYADDFYDNNRYGWNKPHGDGVLILDNWYEDASGSQKGSWISTSGKMIDIIGAREEYAVLDAMDIYIDESPYLAYGAAITCLTEYGVRGEPESEDAVVPILFAIVVSVIVALGYAFANLRQTAARDTTVPSTYMVEGSRTVNMRVDDFVRKSVVTQRIESGSGGGHSGGHSGGGSAGRHVSSGGHSHGGGGRRR